MFKIGDKVFWLAEGKWMRSGVVVEELCGRQHTIWDDDGRGTRLLFKSDLWPAELAEEVAGLVLKKVKLQKEVNAVDKELVELRRLE